MSWGEIKKAVNTNLNKALDVLIGEKTTEVKTEVTTVKSNVGSNADAASSSGSIHAKLKELRTFTDAVSPIKSIQRGVTSAAGNVTISSVNMSKTVVFSKSKGSAGYVAARGSVSVSGSYNTVREGGGSDYMDNYTGTQSMSGSISGGSTDLTVKQYSAKLTTATNIYCDGPVEWQVVQYK